MNSIHEINYRDFLVWVSINYPELRDSLYTAFVKWCAEYELEWFENLDKDSQVKAIIEGTFRTGLTGYFWEDLLEIYAKDLDELILQKIITPIELTKLIKKYLKTQ